jgi:hypothetical protein
MTGLHHDKISDYRTSVVSATPACLADTMFNSAHPLDITVKDVCISSKSLPENAVSTS